MPPQFASPTDKVDVHLTNAERILILEEIFIYDQHLLRPIANTPREQPVAISLDDLDDLANYVDENAQRDCHKERRPRLQRLVRKFRDLLNSHAFDGQSSFTPAAVTKEPGFPVRYSTAQRRAIADCIPEFAERLRLSEPNARVLQLALSELQHIKKQARRAVISVSSGTSRNSLNAVIATTCDALEKYQPGGIGRISSSRRVYQLRISIVDISPEIWRRIQIKECTLDRLHEHIQLAFGWWNYHLHQFVIDGQRYGDPWLLDNGFEDDDDFENSIMTKLSDVVPKDGNRFQFTYEYDFGDGWEFEVLFEGCLEAPKGERYPVCLEGERACPPEDVGGVGGYFDYCEAMADPAHEEHKDLMAWRGPYDPEAFDAVKVTKQMRRGMPKPEDGEP